MTSNLYDTLQFVVFINGRPKRDAIELWSLANSTQRPENFQQLPNGGSVAGGSFKGLILTFQVQAGRIDVVLAPPPDSKSTEIPPISEGTKWAVELCRAAAVGEDLHRVAVVFQASQEMQSMQEAVQTIGQWAKAAYPQGAIDLSYQTIVPRSSSSTANVQIHRLARWNTGRRVQLAVSPEGTLETSVLIANKYVDVYVFGQIPAGSFENLLDEVVKEATDILDKGYDVLC